MAADLRRIYSAPSADLAAAELDDFELEDCDLDAFEEKSAGFFTCFVATPFRRLDGSAGGSAPALMARMRAPFGPEHPLHQPDLPFLHQPACTLSETHPAVRSKASSSLLLTGSMNPINLHRRSDTLSCSENRQSLAHRSTPCKTLSKQPFEQGPPRSPPELAPGIATRKDFASKTKISVQMTVSVHAATCQKLRGGNSVIRIDLYATIG